MTIIDSTILAGDAFVDGVDVSRAQRQAVLAISNVAIDGLVTFKNAVGVFTSSSNDKAEPLTAMAAPPAGMS